MNQTLPLRSLETFTYSLMLQLPMREDFQADTMLAIQSMIDTSFCEASPLAATTNSSDATFEETLDQRLQNSHSDACQKAVPANADRDCVAFVATKPARLLGLPFEVRHLIYQELLSDISLSKIFRDRRDPLFSLGRDTSFPPSKRAAAAYAILLSCRQCYDEGIILYYRWAKVSHFGQLDRWCLQRTPSYHAQRHTQDCSYADVQCFPTYLHTNLVLPGVTSNLSMVMKYSQDFVEMGPSWLSNFRFAQSARRVTIKLPPKNLKRKHFYPVEIPAGAFPSDEQLIAHLKQDNYLPSKENGYLLQFEHRKWVVPTRHVDNEEEMIERLLSNSHIKFIVRFSIRYPAYGQDDWEICEYDLSSRQLIHRSKTSVEIVELEDYLYD